MQRNKVLMLGWEYPPLINGGLGVACHGISHALADILSVTMILPVSSAEFREKKLNILGLKNTGHSDIGDQEVFNQSRQVSMRYIPIDIDPYYSTITDANTIQLNYFDAEPDHSIQFHSTDLYGNNMLEKVHQFALAAEQLAAELDFDIIHVHDWMTIPAGLRLKKRTGKPLVIHIHSLETDRSGEINLSWVFELERQGMKEADLLIPVSKYTADSIKKFYDINPKKIQTVHNGIHSTQFFRKNKMVAEKIVLFVGRITRQKGPEFFIEIAERVLEQNNNVRFIMAGTGDYLQRVIEQSAGKSIGSKMHFTGFLNSEYIKNLFSIADVYCMPSVSEPFGLTAIEAAQFKVPCVISKQSGVAEVLKAALQFDFWDVKKAASQILSLLKYPVLRQQLVEDATKDLQMVNWNISAERILSAYREFGFL